jgi:hypothetical protein
MQVANTRALLGALDRANVAFILVGGTAATLQGSALATFDVHVVHARTQENIERLLAMLESINARYRGRPDLKPTAIHLASTGHNLLLTDLGPFDVLGAIEGGRDYNALLEHSVDIDLQGQSVRILTLDFMLKLKENSADPKDRNSALYLRKAIQEKHRLPQSEPDPE